MATIVDEIPSPQHIVLAGVSWSYYERTLEEIGDQPIRVAFLDGVMELMSPLPKHDGSKTAIGDWIAALTEERRIPRKSFGSTTFRREEKAAGSEPDESFYFYDIDSVKGMEKFDHRCIRLQNIRIEVDIFNPSVPREPIYSNLAYPKVSRYGRNRLTVPCSPAPAPIWTPRRAGPFARSWTWPRLPASFQDDRTRRNASPARISRVGSEACRSNRPGDRRRLQCLPSATMAARFRDHQQRKSNGGEEAVFPILTPWDSSEFSGPACGAWTAERIRSAHMMSTPGITEIRDPARKRGR